MYSLARWDDNTTFILTQEKSLLDHLYRYWLKFSIHLSISLDANAFQQTWQAYKIITSSDMNWYKTMGFNKRSIFPNRLKRRITHSLAEYEDFTKIYDSQLGFYQKNKEMLARFIYKYFLPQESE